MTDPTIRNILACRTDRLGDVVLTLPACTVLREQYPDANIRFLARKYAKPLVQMHSAVDEVCLYDPEGRHKGWAGIRRLADELRQMKLDLAILFYPRPALALALWLARVPMRVGTGYRWYSSLLNRRIKIHRRTGGRHELECNLELMRELVERIPEPDEVVFAFKLDEHVRRRGGNAARYAGLVGDYVIIHPGSGGSAPKLPEARFADIVREVTQTHDCDVLLAGLDSEEVLLRRVWEAAGSPERARIATGWDLETYSSVIAGSRLFISNSTGPLHIARALGIKVLGFYCRSLACAPSRWGPYNRPDAVMTPPQGQCPGCDGDGKEPENCLDMLPWEDIQLRLGEILSGGEG